MSTTQREGFTGLGCAGKGTTAEERRGARRLWLCRKDLYDCRVTRGAAVWERCCGDGSAIRLEDVRS